MPPRLPARPLARPALQTFAALALLGAGACTPASSRAVDSTAAGDSATTGAATAATPAPADTAWRPLIDASASAWRGYKSDALPAGWQVEAGELRRVAQGGDIVTREQFGDFELELEWKTGKGGNSGIFYRGGEATDAIYETAPEMQVLDDAAHVDGKNALTSAGALYGLYAPPRGVVKPAGEWNAARIVARGNHVEHWLNGTKVVDAELWSPDWNARLAKSKFTAWPGYAKAARGHVGLQDHGDAVAFRSIRIRSLD